MVATHKEHGAGLGARYLGGKKCSFLIWAPKAKTVDVHILAPDEVVGPLYATGSGYFYGELSGLQPGVRYKYRLNGGEEFPDPVSRYQPEGVHGPSEIVAPEFPWIHFVRTPCRDVHKIGNV
jgi:maltooligosyltrehalose trehalohydrolase